ncbi:MAG: S8 family serine peptidase [Candidatus Kapabacteria bacterium]|nr:S8 family serine peptidase [Candidatus Kapabacteria bacterium]MDW8012394.1 S8 family serine peptidase [Bacteroidota bacterium]
MLRVALTCLVALSLTQAAVPDRPKPVGERFPIFVGARPLPNGMTTVPAVFWVSRNPEQYVPGVVILKTRQMFVVPKGSRGFASSVLMHALEPFRVQSVRQVFPEYVAPAVLQQDVFGLGRIYEVRYAAPVDPYDVCKALKDNPEVEYAEPLYKRHLLYTPNDPRFSAQWFLQRIAATGAWDITRGDTAITIAVIDTGTDWEHEDLAANIWRNPREVPGNGVDDDGNGKVDDVRGWDFVGNVTLQQAMSGQFREDNDPKVRPTASGGLAHGTQTAGCASAVTDNATGIASAGFRCRIIPIKCASDNPQTPGVWRGYEAILYAARLGAHIINTSWGGGGGSATEYQVIQQAIALGSLVVAGVGNNGVNVDYAPFYPACYPGVLSVGATTLSDAAASWSNYGVAVQVYAPGENILTTTPNDGYGTTGGTSFSGPIVAGVAALVKTLHRDWTPWQILHQIRSTADNVLASTLAQRPLYYGRVNAQRAVAVNRRFDQGVRLPGIGLAENDPVLIRSATGAISSYDPHTVVLRLKNYLGPATSVTVQLQSVDGYATVTPPTSSVGAIGAGEIKGDTISIQLRPTNPWYLGTVDFLVTIRDQGTGYENYFYLSIPVELPTSNQYAAFFGVPPVYRFYSAHAVQPDFLWAVGTFQEQQGVFLRYVVGQNPAAGPIANAPMYAVFALDAQRAFAGSGPTDGQAAIYRTQNGGATWQAVSVATITPFVNDVRFFNDAEGIFLGDPRGSTWGIGRTTDGGQTWQRVTAVPPPLQNEAGLVGSVWWLGDTCWFGTTAGRVFRSTNRGQSWQVSQLSGVSGYVTQVVFRNGREGIAVYRPTTQQGAPYLVAASTDGGASWQLNVANLTSLGFLPVYGYAPPNSWEIFLLGANGAVLGTANLGRDWRPVLTMETGGVSLTGAGVPVQNRARLWTVGDVVGYLDFDYARTNVRRELSAPASLQFDTVEVGFSRTRLLTLQNTGDTALQITDLTIVPVNAAPGEYEILNPPSLPVALQPSATLTLRLRFTPAQAGQRTATLRVTSTAANSPRDVTLYGVGRAGSTVGSGPSGVPTIRWVQLPDGGMLAELTVEQSQWVELQVSDLRGAVVAHVRQWVDQGTSYVRLPTPPSASGLYFWRLALAGTGRSLGGTFLR